MHPSVLAEKSPSHLTFTCSVFQTTLTLSFHEFRRPVSETCATVLIQVQRPCDAHVLRHSVGLAAGIAIGFAQGLGVGVSALPPSPLCDLEPSCLPSGESPKCPTQLSSHPRLLAHGTSSGHAGGWRTETQDHSGSEMLNVHFLKRTVCLSGFQTNLALFLALLKCTGALHGPYPERQVRLDHS